ncbi:ribosome small subunit-dependent GTPase A [Adhaeretor mobilis]|uniref:Small ribosomal subunit biogenesis GTPase RsgA n=1 Tax=Adhaeretor mobilis TaxID=1930276 RepID=A0A517MRZ7_9BACT|nr:ribosome small subunit-dependent GTPase A [Adhaeretor mobilis]QDS97658.1 Putative ribosome biogenesis GTPase RsgA [Adhaeretor mobilis]
MSNFSLRNIGWKPFFQQQVSLEELETGVVARVSAHHGSQILMLGEAGEFSIPAQLAQAADESAGGTAAGEAGACGIAVGDWLLLDAQDHRAIRRLERDTLLFRKAAGEEVKPQVIAANLDTIFIVTSCNEDFNLSRIERYLALTLQAGATPVVVLTKADLCENPAELRHQAEQLHAGLLVETLDARESEQADVLKSWCGPGQSVVLLGSSGVGKSTLANALGTGQLATGGIREKDGKGRHTTTARSLHLLPSGGVLIDNPGVRELQLPACEEGLTDLFEDVLVIARNCRFSNCSHEGDAGCAVMAALEAGELDQRRFASFQKLNAEQAHNSRSLAERRERDRKTGRMYKSMIDKKRRRREES